MRILIAGLTSAFLFAACTPKDNSSSAIVSDNTQISGDLSKPGLAECKIQASVCSAVDLDHDDAKTAYEIGCEAKDFYACSRLGQYFEVKAQNIEEAFKAYAKGCAGKDEDACDNEEQLRSKLCYLDLKKEFCKGEPTGEFRMLVFLQNLDTKYEDAFVDRDFTLPISIEPARKLYEQRMKEKNPKLLKALKLSLEKGKHDGADAESLIIDIATLEGKTKELLKADK